jgi:hypothetical protein
LRICPTTTEIAKARELTRREALGRAAKFGGAIVWAVPFVQTVDIRAAGAFARSPEPDAHIQGGSGTITNPQAVGSDGASQLQILDLTAGRRLRRNGKDYVRIGFLVSGAASVRVKIVKGNRVVRSLVVRDFLASGRVQTRWNGKNARGKWVASGRYSVLISATDNSGNSAEARCESGWCPNPPIPSPAIGELLIDLEDKAARAVVFGLLAEMERG